MLKTKEINMSMWKLALSLLTKIVSQGRLYGFIYVIYIIYTLYMSLESLFQFPSLEFL